jgi:carboxyl-terminal processing protease
MKRTTCPPAAHSRKHHLVIWGLTLGLCLTFPLVVVRPASADPDQPRTKDRQVTLAVCALLKYEHLLQHPLDDEISERGIKNFFDMLDPGKVYFYKADVDEFMKRRHDLDDQVRRGDISFGYAVFDRFLERIDQRVAVIEKLIEEEHEFTVDEEMVTDAELLDYPADEDEARDRWRKRIKFDLLILKSDDEDDEEEDGAKETPEDPRERLLRRYRSFAKRMHQIDEDELMEMYLSALTSGYDPHTRYMSPSTYEDFKIEMGLKLEGIGASLRPEDGYTIVTKIVPGGAAAKEGSLEAEDKIVAVGQGVDGEMVEVIDMKLRDVVKQIRGKADTVVRLEVIKHGSNERKIISITRAKIELKDREARSVIFEAGRKRDGGTYKIGVINLPAFYMDMTGARLGVANFKSTTRDVKKIVEEFKEKSVDALVLDLRHNGGGSLTEAINLTGLFIDQGPVVQVKTPEGRVMAYNDREFGMAWNRPLVVVTSKESASASEILAGAIQDYRRGLIVGDKATHGKGTVQSLLEIGSRLFRTANAPNLGALKITMQQFYRPSGESTQKRGVLADVVLPSLTTYKAIGEDDLDYAVQFDRVPAADYDRYSMVDGELIGQLATRSESRIGESTEFNKLAESIVRYRENKARKRVSLNEERFMERQEEFESEREAWKRILGDLDEDGEDIVVKRDFYFDEILAITVDYIEMLNRRSDG